MCVCVRVRSLSRVRVLRASSLSSLSPLAWSGADDSSTATPGFTAGTCTSLRLLATALLLLPMRTSQNSNKRRDWCLRLLRKLLEASKSNPFMWMTTRSWQRHSMSVSSSIDSPMLLLQLSCMKVCVFRVAQVWQTRRKEPAQQRGGARVVVSAPFILFLLHNHFINRKKN
jgi:hypothetical protein